MVEEQALGGRAVKQHAPGVQHDDALAHALNRARIVRDEHDRRSGGDLCRNSPQALALERLVADCQNLIDQQDVGIQMGGD